MEIGREGDAEPVERVGHLSATDLVLLDAPHSFVFRERGGGARSEGEAGSYQDRDGFERVTQ